MAGRYVSDVETNGHLHELTKIHSMVLIDIDTEELHSFVDQPGYRPLSEGLKMAEEADLLIGHNWIGFDDKAIRKVFPDWKPKGRIRDTLVLARLLWPHISERDHRAAARGKFPKHLLKRTHSLEAWGCRLDMLKDDFKGPWDEWSPVMHTYMEQDGRVTLALWKRCVKEAEEWGLDIFDFNPPPGRDCIELEHRMDEICHLIEAHGFRVNESKLHSLAAKLGSRKLELEKQLQITFPPKEVATPFIPKANNKTRGYVKGELFIKRKTVPFNPSSRKQIAERLIDLGWKPVEFGKDGVPTVDEDILKPLPWPEAAVLVEYLTVVKRLGQVVNGKEAWLRHIRNGRIHGRITSGGAHTGRATHSNPNMGQIPSVSSPYGAECRDAFEADKGHVLIGIDEDGLELRDLAGYMALFDNGEYIDVVLNGRKEDGTDMHTRNANVLGCGRGPAKTFFYAFIYGAYDETLGRALGETVARAAKAAGATARANISKGVPALGRLIKAVQKRIKKRGYLVGLDGRRLFTRSRNAALNTLLQSAGAVQSKRWIVTVFDELRELGLEWGADWAISMWVHDEIQVTAKPEFAEMIVKLSVELIEAAGKFYSFACPLTGEAKVGLTWKETH